MDSRNYLYLSTVIKQQIYAVKTG